MRKCKACKGKLARPSSLKTIYKALLEKTVLYGAELMHNVDKKALNATGALLKQAQRIITGTTKRTQSECLLFLSGDVDIHTKLDNAKLGFWARKSTQAGNVAGSVLNDIEYNKNRSKRGKGVGVVKQTNFLLKQLNIDKNLAAPHTFTHSPDYNRTIGIDYSLTNKIDKKSSTDIFMKQETLEHITTKYPNHLLIFTDGSKNPDNTNTEPVGIGIYSSKKHVKIQKSLRISNDTAIATAELKAIDVALKAINNRAKSNKDLANKSILICTDSLSAVQAIESQKQNTSRPDLVQKISLRSFQIKNEHNLLLDLLWIPSHVGINGNEKADRLAKLALRKNSIDLNIGLGKTELTNLIKKRQKLRANVVWQASTSKSVKHMREIVPSVFDNNIPLNRQYERRNRLLVNAPKFLSKGPVTCEFCRTDKNVQHVLLHCDLSIGYREDLKRTFNKYNHAFNLNTLLAPNPPSELKSPILNYINELVEDI